MFRLSSIAITDLDQQHEIEFNIQRTLEIRVGTQNSSWQEGHTPRGDNSHQNRDPEGFDQNGNNSNVGDDVENEVDYFGLQADLEAQRDDILGIQSAGYQIVSAFDSVLSRIQGEVKRLTDGISDLQRDRTSQDTKTKFMEKNIASIEAEVQHLKDSANDTPKSTRLEAEIAATKQTVSTSIHGIQDTLSELQASSQTIQKEHDSTRSDLGTASLELKALRKELEATEKLAKESAATAKANAKDTLAARTELQRVKEDLARVQSERQTSPGGNAFLAQQLEILSRDMTLIEKRASQVEPLQRELQLLKSRVQWVESRNKPPAVDAGSTVSPFPRHEAAARTGDARRAQDEVSRKRKLPDSNLTEPQSRPRPWAVPPAKRAALADRPSSTLEYHTSKSSRPSLATGADPHKATPGPRFTKSGAIDKRTLPWKRSQSD